MQHQCIQLLPSFSQCHTKAFNCFQVLASATPNHSVVSKCFCRLLHKHFCRLSHKHFCYLLHMPIITFANNTFTIMVIPPTTMIVLTTTNSLTMCFLHIEWWVNMQLHISKLPLMNRWVCNTPTLFTVLIHKVFGRVCKSVMCFPRRFSG